MYNLSTNIEDNVDNDIFRGGNPNFDVYTDRCGVELISNFKGDEIYQ